MEAPGRGRSAGIVDRLLLAPNWKEADRAGRIVAVAQGNFTLPVPLEHPGKILEVLDSTVQVRGLGRCSRVRGELFTIEIGR